MPAWLFFLFPMLLPLAYVALLRPGLRVELEGFRIYRGMVPGLRFDFNSVRSIQLERREWRNYVYYRLYIDVNGRLICGGDEDDFHALKLTLQRLCRVYLEEEKAVANLGINEVYGTYPEPIGRRYYCDWGR